MFILSLKNYESNLKNCLIFYNIFYEKTYLLLDLYYKIFRTVESVKILFNLFFINHYVFHIYKFDNFMIV
jgi:hypothetical protein